MNMDLFAVSPLIYQTRAEATLKTNASRTRTCAAYLNGALQWNVHHNKTSVRTILNRWIMKQYKRRYQPHYQKPQHHSDDLKAWANQIWASDHPSATSGETVYVALRGTDRQIVEREARKHGITDDQLLRSIVKEWSDELLISQYGVDRIEWEMDTWFLAGPVEPPEMFL